jgi:hypothetical protein
MGWRIKVITESYIPFAFITVLALASFGKATLLSQVRLGTSLPDSLGGSLALTIDTIDSPLFAGFNEFRAAPIVWLMTSAAADVTIAVCLVYALVRIELFTVSS